MLDDWTEVDERKGIDRYVDVDCEGLVIAHFEDALAQLQRWPAEPLRLYFAARSVHSAMVAALTTAIAGTDSTGAFVEKARKEWLAFFETMRDGFEEVGPSDRVMSFREMIAKAQRDGGGWLTEPLSMDADTLSLIDRLTVLRDRMEHPRPELMAYQPEFILETLPPAIELGERFLSQVKHRLDAIQSFVAVRTITALSEQVELLLEKSRASDKLQASQ